MRLQKMIVYNRAPFENLVLDFDDSNITVLSGINGAGKTTLISYIVDSMYEMAKRAFKFEFGQYVNHFYRISSDIDVMNESKPSIVYLRYSHDDGFIDYIDSRGECSEEQYKEIARIQSPIEYGRLSNDMQKGEYLKEWSTVDTTLMANIFDHNIMTYFPAYRYETPSYLNDHYKTTLAFNTQFQFTGKLKNKIEVDSDLPQIVNWIMDVALDSKVNQDESTTLLSQILAVLSLIVMTKHKCICRLGIGKRNKGIARLCLHNAVTNDLLYPSIFYMSSGELALLCLFGELLKQTDMLGSKCDTISGIVLVDEIEKHLHIQLQREVLPKLMGLFPNLQFIVTSHSPFLGLGLEKDGLSYSIRDLDKGGISCLPQNNELFNEVYQVMIDQNQQFAAKYNQLKDEVQKNSKPLIITEGKTDWKHLEAAKRVLGVDDLDVVLYKYEDVIGDRNLLNMLKGFARFSQNRLIIGVFDRDDTDILKEIDADSQMYHSFGNNVFAFSIPNVHQDIYGEIISTEHYYIRNDLCKTDANGRRLFLGCEFYESGISKDGCFQTRCKDIQKKVKNNAVIDDKVYKREDLELKNSIALTKNDFAQYILEQDVFAEGFDFSAFNEIFDVVRQIISINQQE